MNIELIKNPVLPLSAPIPRVSHYGTIHIGGLVFEGVVLETGMRGYTQTDLVQAIGFRGKILSSRFRLFLAETAPNTLNLLGNSDPKVVVMPSGGHANFLPAGILTEIAAGVMESAATGNLHTQTARAAEITQILATAIHRTHLSQAKNPNHRERQVDLGFPPAQRVHTTPYQPEKTR